MSVVRAAIVVLAVLVLALVVLTFVNLMGETSGGRVPDSQIEQRQP